MKWLVIFLKELVDALRDRRALTTALSFALLGPIVLVLMINMMAASARPGTLEAVKLCGPGQAPALIEAITAADIRIEETADVCLTIPEDFEARLQAGQPARVEIRADLASSGSVADRLEDQILRFSRGLAAQRLMSRGVAPDAASPIAVDIQNTNTASRGASALGGAIILYLIYAPFIIVASMAADMTAGERERRSIEPLLSHPVRYSDIAIGKFIALSAVNVAGTAACVAISLLMLSRSPAPELGLRLEADFEAGLVAMFWLAPLCVLVSAAQLYLGLLSRSFKEAQQSLMLASIVPVLIGFVLISRPDTDVGLWPVAWEIRALAEPLLNSNSTSAPFAIVAAIELALAAGFVLAGARRLRSERVLA